MKVIKFKTKNGNERIMPTHSIEMSRAGTGENTRYWVVNTYNNENSYEITEMEYVRISRLLDI